MDEAGGATQAQIEVNKKREAELQKLRRDLEESHLQSESQLAAMRKKQQDSVNELSEQLDQLQKNKQKTEKEKQAMKTELDDLRSQLDHIGKGKGNAEKLGKQLEGQLSELNSKLEQSQRDAQELNNQKSRSLAENAELLRKLEEAESQLNLLTKTKQALSKSLEEAKAGFEEEGRLRSKLQGDNRNLQVGLLCELFSLSICRKWCEIIYKFVVRIMVWYIPIPFGVFWAQLYWKDGIQTMSLVEHCWPPPLWFYHKSSTAHSESHFNQKVFSL